MTKVRVCKHAIKRIRKRIGLPKHACQSHAQRAFDRGSDRLKELIPQKSGRFTRVYGDFIFVFAEKTLITVLNIPNRFK